MDKMKMYTPNLADENYRKLAALFPNAVTESVDPETGEVVRAIDADVLRQEISGRVVEGREERYQFTWPDKKKAMLAANAPIAATLRPVRADSVGRDGTPGGWDSENLYIEGDNLDVLKLLQETYLGKIKMIYIDPPYNTGHDFVYSDDFYMDEAVYRPNSGLYDSEGNLLDVYGQNTDANGRFHTDWLNMILPRLKLCKNLLTDDGVIFISVDDHELNNLYKVCCEVFGEQYFIGQIAIVNNLKGRNDRKDIATCHEYVLIFGKSEFTANGLPLTEEQRAAFDCVDENGNRYQLRDLRKRGRPDRREDRPNMYFPIYYNPETKECSVDEIEGAVAIYPLRGDGSDGRWRWGKDHVREQIHLLEPRYSSIAKRWGIQTRIYLNPALNGSINEDDEEDGETAERLSKSKSFWMGGELSTDVARRTLKDLFGSAFFDYPKAVEYIKNTICMGSDSDSIILDFFSGSATTAHAVMQLNSEDGGQRRFIMVQLPEKTELSSEAYKAGYPNICEIGKERIRRAGRKIKEEAGLTVQNLDIGFRVLRLDSSNMQDVYYNPAAMTQDLLSATTDNIKPDRTPEDLLFQVMLDLGVELSSPITETVIGGKKVYDVADGFLLACFDTGVTTETVTAIAKKQPYYAVFRDSSIADDSTATNFDQIFESYSQGTVRRVL